MAKRAKGKKKHPSKALAGKPKGKARQPSQPLEVKVEESTEKELIQPLEAKPKRKGRRPSQPLEVKVEESTEKELIQPLEAKPKRKEKQPSQPLRKKAKPRKRHPIQVFFQKATGRFRKIISELRNVSWPTWSEARQLTLLVLAVMVVMGAILGLTDLGARALLNVILGFS